MPLVDSTVLARLVVEARDYALGAIVRRVVQPRHDLVALELSRSGPWSCLVVDWSAEHGRVHLAAEMPAPGLRDQRLGSTLRRQLRGARLEAIEQVAYDRVVRLGFSNCEQLGPQCRRVLICELTGRHGNAVLVDEDGEIIEAGKHVTSRVNRFRETLPGLDYVPPPQFDRISPADATPGALRERAAGAGDEQLGRWLRGGFHGCSDLFIAEVCQRVGADPELSLADLPEGWQDAVADHLAAIAREASGPGESWVYYDERGERPELAYPVGLTHLAGRRHERVESLSAAIEDLHARELARREMAGLRERIGAAVRQAETKAQRVLEVRQAAVDRARDAEADRERGELLMAYMHQIGPGVDQVTLPAFDGSGEVTVRLRPELSALDNARRYFARYKKAQRLAKLAPRLLADARHELEYLGQVRAQVDLAEDAEDLERIEQELTGEGYLKPRKRATPPPRRQGPRTITTSDGYALLYGKSGLENDDVLRAARADDLWFHVKGGPGSHVVLRTNGRPDDVPETSVYEAAQLAARLSGRRREARVEVDMAPAADVRKPRGGRPGLAYYHATRTIPVSLATDTP
ncbi:MAG TPA: NFACT RNA binding domain-containing protein [Armatimonadota bacterium]|nr:NFACT RNA binding domain-containing protein [Armatimonadota bacterium]